MKRWTAFFMALTFACGVLFSTVACEKKETPAGGAAQKTEKPAEPAKK